MKYSILLGLLLSVSVFLASMLVVSVAHAGRESHGIMPMGYACEKISSQGAGLRVDLPMLTGQIQGARLSCGEKEIAPFACEDLSGQISLGSDKVVTVTCHTSSQPSMELILKESRDSAELWIWKFRSPNNRVLIGILPCY